MKGKIVCDCADELSAAEPQPREMKGVAPGRVVFGFKNTRPRSNAMKAFVQRHATQIEGVVSGFDRLRFRGTVRLLACLAGMQTRVLPASIADKRTGKNQKADAS